MAPYFTINHAIRGRLAGPFGKLPVTSNSASYRRLALDVAATLLAQQRQQQQTTQPLTSRSSSGSDASEKSGRMLGEAVDAAVGGTEDEAYWRHLSLALGWV